MRTSLGSVNWVFFFSTPLNCWGFGWKGCLSLAAKSGLPCWFGVEFTSVAINLARGWVT